MFSGHLHMPQTCINIIKTLFFLEKKKIIKTFSWGLALAIARHAVVLSMKWKGRQICHNGTSILNTNLLDIKFGLLILKTYFEYHVLTHGYHPEIYTFLIKYMDLALQCCFQSLSNSEAMMHPPFNHYQIQKSIMHPQHVFIKLFRWLHEFNG